MIWIAISIAISLTLSFLLPFPLSLVAIIGVFIAMNYYMRRRQMRRMGMTGSNTGGGGFGSLFGGSGGGGINYVCIACGQRFKGGSCPRCGSKMKRADFWLLLDKVSFWSKKLIQAGTMSFIGQDLLLWTSCWWGSCFSFVRERARAYLFCRSRRENKPINLLAFYT